MKKRAYIYGKSCERLSHKVQQHPLSYELVILDYTTFINQKNLYDRVIVSGDIDEIKAVLSYAIEKDIEVSVLPKDDQLSLQDAFSLSKDLSENLTMALTEEAKRMDILYANEELVLHTALVGDAPPLNYHISKYRNISFKERIYSLYQAYLKVKQLRHTRLTLKTAKLQEIETVATGVVVIEYDNKTCASKLIDDMVSINDTKLDALIISPKSIAEYLQLMSKAIFNKNKSATLPNAIGYIQSRELFLESKIPLPLFVDGREVGSTPVNFTVKPDALKICLPQSFWKKVPSTINSKETMKIDKLPRTHERMNYLQKKLPFFTHAGEERYKRLFSTLKEEGQLSSAFMVLMFLSSILATVGLYLNSASVIIGAMVLAPLMNPIVAFSMALLRQDDLFSLKSIKTIFIGILITLLTSAMIAWGLPFEHTTQEMAGRIKPSILDMIVAIVSGVAAAYVKDNSKIINTIAGVAIAVALVPPLATAGIGLGWGDFEMFYQAFLLFLTNLVGIVFAVSLVFLVKGFSPMHRAKKGLFYTLLLSMIIAIPLLNSFVTMVQDARTISSLEHTTFDIKNKKVTLQNVSLSRDEKVEVIKCELLLSKTLNDHEIQLLKEQIEKKLNKDVELEALIRMRF